MTQAVAEQFRPLVSRLGNHGWNAREFGIQFWDGSQIEPEARAHDAPVLQLKSPDALNRMVQAPGELGLSRAWVSGDLDVQGDLEQALLRFEAWRQGRLHISDTPELVKVLKQTGALKLERLPKPESEIILNGRLHSMNRDQSAIQHHYDVSNRFYRMMLGPSMVYSCAYFSDENESLEAAQTRKLDLICRKLELGPGEKFLDIGCGWGSLLIHAAKRYRVRATGVTLSQQQADYAREWIAQEGLEGMCSVRVQDYRDIQDGPYDKIASVGMFEHVGKRNLWLYLSRTKELLAEGGLFLNHGIVRTNSVRVRRQTFSKRFVFPDGELSTQGRVIQEFEDVGFELLDDESLRPHYATTLKRWAENMQANHGQIVDEIGVERERVWRLHNVGAALAFQSEKLSIHQALLRGLQDGQGRPPSLRRSYMPN